MFGATFGGFGLGPVVHSVLLTPHSEITPRGSQGTLWYVRDQSWVNSVQSKCPTQCTAPKQHFNFNHFNPLTF